MAVRTFLHASSDFNDVNNWSAATVPVTSDTVDFVNAGSQALSTNNDWSAKNTLTVHVSEDHAGQIGASGAAWTTGTGWTLDYDGRRCPVMYIETNTANTTTWAKIRSSSANGVVWSGTGTITDLYVVEGLVRLTGTLTVTDIYLLGPYARVSIEGALTITNIYQQGGLCHCESDVTTVHLSAGEFDLVGDGSSEGDITTFNQYGGICYFSAAGREITTYNGYGGTLDLRRSNTPRTIDTGNFYHGNTAILDDGVDNISATTALNKYGGKLLVGPSLSVTGTIEENFRA